MILKQNQIFDNISLAFKPRVIKVSPKSDMSIVWIDIWDVQSGSNTKTLINRCFNVRRYIATIQGANMNPGVPQCKNCWKWGHMTFSCRIQGSKCVKCNGPYKSKNHCEFGWCCKTNDRINPPRLETKKGEPCPHSFKCLNCWGDHQVIPTNVRFGDIGLTGSGNKKNMLRSVITDPSRFVLRWTANFNYNCEKPQNSFAKCLQKLPHHQHPPWDPKCYKLKTLGLVNRKNLVLG